MHIKRILYTLITTNIAKYCLVCCRADIKKNFNLAVVHKSFINDIDNLPKPIIRPLDIVVNMNWTLHVL